MNISSENSTNLRYSWEEPIESNPQFGSNLCATSPSYGLDYAVPHDVYLPNTQPAHVADLGGLQNNIRPYDTNWGFFENYNTPANFDCDGTNDIGEPAHRIRMNSMASSASSQSYSLTDDKRIYLPSIQSEAPDILLGCNTPYRTGSQSSYDTTYSSHYDDRITPQSHSTHPDQPHQGGLGLPTSCSFGGYPEIYMQSFRKDFRAKAPTYSLDRPYKCDKCGSSFSRNHDLKRHARIHLDIKPFPCSCCDKAFARKDALKRHLLVKGCSKTKEGVSRGSPQNSERQKLSKSPNALGPKYAGQQDKSLRPSLVHSRSNVNGNQSSPIHVPKSTGTGIPSQFNEIKLQNIKCSMPNFM
ncbi:hypothetical protein PGTUg99_022826 [Puccinia graminis f. sp. tritici]|uniref:C2H2-type domain-containing protein n=1 Tax=Puccinia graminis f. sp. tritici TaxID=56615 RepID=A0A5B0R7F5_PUCGR|nr:hypothetical protein PGTUg99_022826 [Puccinia graminis f. sp. tritici]